MAVLKYNLTALSEESGELALGLLAKSLNPQNRCDFDQVNEKWRRVRMLHEARLTDPKPSAQSLRSKLRFVGTSFFSFSHLSLYYFFVFVCLFFLNVSSRQPD